MKINLLPAAAAAAGDLLGAATGHRRYRQITTAARDLVTNPRLQQLAFDLAGRARTNAPRLPGPAAGLLSQAATRVQDALTRPGHDDPPAATDPAESTATTTEAGI